MKKRVTDGPTRPREPIPGEPASQGFSRRTALQGLGLGLGTVAIGCGEGSGEDALASESAATDPSTARSRSELLAGIEHIVVLMMENRSFDHYLGTLASDPAYPGRANVRGLSGTESNLAPDGSKVPVFKMTNFTPEDLPHEWEAAHAQFNGGRNDGFVKAHEGGSQNEAMGYHDRSQIPLYYWFADNFTVCDNWFSSVMGPTWPNRFYLHATTSKGKKKNSPLWSPPDTIWHALKAGGFSAKNFGAGIVTFFVGGFPTLLFGVNPSASIREFFDGARTGNLPSFSLIDPDFQASDDHPSHNIQRGQAFVASVYKALADSPLWSKTLLIVTYDEHGGFYDHVPPPKTVDDDAEFAQLGFRVPAFVIGPTVKKGYVCKTQLEHSSVAATLKTRWGIRSLTRRMDATNDVTDCIDPQKVHAPAPPPGGMPVVAMSRRTALYDGVGTSSQPGLDEVVARGAAGPINPIDHQERIGEWLENAVRLGAVRIVGD